MLTTHESHNLLQLKWNIHLASTVFFSKTIAADNKEYDENTDYFRNIIKMKRHIIRFIDCIHFVGIVSDLNHNASLSIGHENSHQVGRRQTAVRFPA